LYKKARAGEIKNYTGIDSAYEAPQKGELVLDTENNSIEDCVAEVLQLLNDRDIFNVK
jgi:adenylylsulfate kinase-like enzyme